VTTGADTLHDPGMVRRAGRDLLSLALIDARNALLQHLAHDESPEACAIAQAAGAWAEHWINRHVQRGRGERCQPDAPRLGAGDPVLQPPPGAAPPMAVELRESLARSLEATLDLLAAADDSDDALHFFRLALRHEDRCVEGLAWQAVQRGEPLVLPAPGGGGAAPPARPERAAILLPAQRWLLGSPPGPGHVPEAERWAHEVALPAFEIDAQPVNWAQMAEFAGDGGYDRPELWTGPGWAWAQAGGRRAPTGVAQWAGGVVLERGARLQRVHPQQPVLGVTRHEAQAWCRWAGRRLPTEPEWEAAACSAGHRGLAWGDVLEWVAGSGRPYAGPQALPPVPGEIDPLPAPDGLAAVLRGAAWLSPPRSRHPRARRFAAPDDDTLPSGFRSCAL
jgi:formylglycine-generating enzyme required for sulfatase activity